MTDLKKIKNWDYKDVFNLIQYVISEWAWKSCSKIYWTKGKRSNKKRTILYWELHTGGLSDNEEIINALLENKMFVMLAYVKWERGGHYYFEIDPYSLGYVPVQELATKLKVSKQYIHRTKEKYIWLDFGNPILLVKPTTHPASTAFRERK